MAEFNFGFGIQKQNRIVSGAAELVRQTPLIGLARLRETMGCVGNVLGKAEYLLPSGFAADRAAAEILASAPESQEGALLVAASGGEAVSLAVLAASAGRRLALSVAADTPEETLRLLETLGAQVFTAPVETLAQELPQAVAPTLSLAEARERANLQSLAPELLRDTYGKIGAVAADYRYAAGLSALLKTYRTGIRVIAAAPEGVSADDVGAVDEVITVSDAQAATMAREAARAEGILLGKMSGAALFAAVEAAKRGNMKNKNVIAVLADRGVAAELCGELA